MSAKKWSSTELDVDCVQALAPLATSNSGEFFALMKCPPRFATLHCKRETEQLTRPLADAPDVTAPAGVGAIVAYFEESRDVVIYYASGGGGGEPRTVLRVPEGARDVAIGVDAATRRIHVACFVDDALPGDDDANAPRVLPRLTEARLLLAHANENDAASSSFQLIARVSSRAERLAISADGSQLAWALMANDVPEEAERGDFLTCPALPGAPVRHLTNVTGRVGAIRLSRNGRFALFAANFAPARPITTRMQLWAQSTARDDADARPVLPHMANEQCDEFAFVVAADGFVSDELVVTYVIGVLPHSVLVRVDATAADVQLQFAETLVGPLAEGSAAPVRLDAASLAYCTESESALPALRAGDATFRLPQSPLFAGFQASFFSFPTSDGHEMTAMFYTSATTPKSAPLLVHVVGGPSVTSRCTLRAACGMTRYPYRALLARGFHIVTPMYRGKLGFGDAFAQLCINNHGVTDLRDIMETIAVTKDKLLVSAEARLGIFGGSYGGYMTMRAMSMHPVTFVTGVAEYGFVSSKFICAEVGDFTWDQEYWPNEPVDAPNAKSDLWPYVLHKIERPVLFTHGADDPICPLSQSKVAYRLLHARGVRTQLVVYPNEKHGYSNAAHKADRCERIAAWFGELFASDLQQQQEQR
jgi:pimeloyl-ACP methyl ester carboxylesterase